MEPLTNTESNFSGWHRAASAELRKACDLPTSDRVGINRHLDQAKEFERRALLGADTTLKRMLAMGLLMTADGMRNVVETGLENCSRALSRTHRYCLRVTLCRMWGRSAAGMATVFAFVLASPPAGAQPDDPFGEDDWVAVAVAPGLPGGGFGVAGASDRAVAIALGECQAGAAGGTCVPVEVIRYGCVAHATQFGDASGSWATGAGPTAEAAGGVALSKLPPGSLVNFTQCWNPRP